MRANSILLDLPWPPSVNHYYRHVGPRVLISREGRKYRKRICALLDISNPPALAGGIEVSIDAFPPDLRRRDLDNLQKSLFDSLQYAGVFKDDSQIHKFTITRQAVCRPNGKIIVALSPLEGPTG